MVRLGLESGQTGVREWGVVRLGLESGQTGVREWSDWGWRVGSGQTEGLDCGGRSVAAGRSGLSPSGGPIRGVPSGGSHHIDHYSNRPK